MFLMAEAEDEEAHGLLVRLFLEKAEKYGLANTDAFLDMACHQGAAAEFERSKHQLFLHRCLQHVKTNIKTESQRRDQATGKPRLRNSELSDVIISWVETSAWFPSDCEFSCFWESILARMSSCAEAGILGQWVMFDIS